MVGYFLVVNGCSCPIELDCLQVALLQRQQDTCTAEAAQLQQQAERLSAPSTFAQSAKLSRKSVALEKKAAGLQQSKVCS